jgi:hypothetical protein
MIHERRTTEGLAIVTARADYIKPRCLAAGIAARALTVQDGPAWPEHRPPLVLDTIGLPVEVLVILLADPPKLKMAKYQTAAHSVALPAEQRRAPKHIPFAPLVALADASDWRTLRLLALCSAVRLIGPADPAELRPWIRHLAMMQTLRRTAPAPAWLISPPPPLRLDPLLLRALAALQVSPSVRVAAEQCDVSVSTMSRLLRATRGVLGMPSGDVSRFRPEEQAAMILARLGADSSLVAKQTREGHSALP